MGHLSTFGPPFFLITCHSGRNTQGPGWGYWGWWHSWSLMPHDPIHVPLEIKHGNEKSTIYIYIDYIYMYRFLPHLDLHLEGISHCHVWSSEGTTIKVGVWPVCASVWVEIRPVCSSVSSDSVWNSVSGLWYKVLCKQGAQVLWPISFNQLQGPDEMLMKLRFTIGKSLKIAENLVYKIIYQRGSVFNLQPYYWPS